MSRPPATEKRCRKCGVVKPAAEFHRKQAGSEVRRSTCKQCNHGEATISTYVSRHGIARSEVVAMAEAQGGCAICGTTDPGGRGWHMDHNHSCERCTRRKGSCDVCRRAVLCSRCNVAIGLFRDDPTVIRAAADYVINWS